ncbi:hypothetical protein ABES74_09320 [Bacillus subtilis]
MKWMSNERLHATAINTAKIINKHRRLIIVVFGILIVLYFIFGRNSGLTQEQFENKLRDLSGGTINIEHSKIEKGNYSATYFANWNGFLISAKVDKHNRLVLPYSVSSPPSGQMNEIALGQYQELMQVVSRIADSKLSKDDTEHLFLNDLNFNNVAIDGIDHSFSKNGIEYTLSGAKNSSNFYMLIIEE